MSHAIGMLDWRDDRGRTQSIEAAEVAEIRDVAEIPGPPEPAGRLPVLSQINLKNGGWRLSSQERSELVGRYDSLARVARLESAARIG